METQDIMNMLTTRHMRRDDRSPGVGTSDKNAVLQNLYPHYTNEYYRHPRSAFGREVDGIEYAYSDRLLEWDYSKHQAAWEHAKNNGLTTQTCAFFEAYLSTYFDRPVEILHILAGWNWGNGYPYQVFGYRFIGE